jgi:hypothetical protein
MKRVLVLLLAAVFLFAGAAFAAEQPKAAKPAPAKGAAKMTATGKILELSDTALKLERSAKGGTTTTDFSLEKPQPELKVGDKVTVSYVTKDGKNMATKVSKAQAAKKTTKKK